MTRTRHRVLGIVLAGLAVSACAKTPEAPSSPPAKVSSRKPAGKKPVSVPSAPTAPVTKRPPNHTGMTFVGEWHHIAVGKTTLHRSPAEFKGDLERLYKLGFRPVTATNWVTGKMELPKGASPVVMTFDDANADQFQLLDDGTVDPNCAVGIWLEFAKTHPDFPVKGTFFVLPSMWSQPKWVGTKLKMLRKWGSEVGSHTVTHPALRNQTPARVQKEIGDASINLEKLGEKAPFTLAYPYGSTPRNFAPLHGFKWKGKKIFTRAAFLVGADPARSPLSKRFDRYRIPRIQAMKGLNGLDYWLDELEKGHVKPYVE